MNSLVLRKWYALLRIWVQDGLAYRAQGVIWVMADLVTTGATMPAIWIAAAHANGGTVGGFTIQQMATYYIAMLTLNGLVNSHVMWEIALEIKEGQFSSALVRPISYYQFSFFRNLSWRLMRPFLFLPFLIVFLIALRGYLSVSSFHVNPAFWASLVAGHLVSFCFVMAVAATAFFTQEVFSIFEIYYVPQILLSGAMFPVSMLPHWAASVPRALPFYYTVGAPSEIICDRIPGSQVWHVVAIQFAWALAFYVVGKAAWAKGLKFYSGVGM